MTNKRNKSDRRIGERLNQPEVITYQEVLGRLSKTKHLLLGNGFSIACDKRFSYPNLFAEAVKTGLSKPARVAFEILGTNNFEGILRLLEDSSDVARIYDEGSTKRLRMLLAKDLKTIKKTLVSVIARTHLSHPGAIDMDRRNRCVDFFAPYKEIFTTNYDLLPYWISMHDQERLKMQDGFRAPEDDPDSDYLVFSETIGRNNGTIFLHGGLHLYMDKGEIRKYSWKRSGQRLTDLIKGGLDSGKYPIFVAEGDSDKKRSQISRNGYLSYCFGKFQRIQNELVIFGHSLGDSDRHIIDEIVHNEKINQLFISLYGAKDSPANIKIQESTGGIQTRRLSVPGPTWKRTPVNVTFFSAESAEVWDKSSSTS